MLTEAEFASIVEGLILIRIAEHNRSHSAEWTERVLEKFAHGGHLGHALAYAYAHPQ